MQWKGLSQQSFTKKAKDGVSGKTGQEKGR